MSPMWRILHARPDVRVSAIIYKTNISSVCFLLPGPVSWPLRFLPGRSFLRSLAFLFFLLRLVATGDECYKLRSTPGAGKSRHGSARVVACDEALPAPGGALKIAARIGRSADVVMSQQSRSNHTIDR